MGDSQFSFEFSAAATSRRIYGVRELVTTVRTHLEKGFPDPAVFDGLSTALVVRYARAFVSGVRDSKYCDEAIASLTEEQRGEYVRKSEQDLLRWAGSEKQLAQWRADARAALARAGEDPIALGLVNGLAMTDGWVLRTLATWHKTMQVFDTNHPSKRAK